VVDLGNGIPGIFGRVAVDRVVIENTEDLCHYCHSSFWANAFRLILAFPLPAGAVRESRFFGGRPAQKTSLHPTVKINK
jgi:hypothetical protein